MTSLFAKSNSGSASVNTVGARDPRCNTLKGNDRVWTHQIPFIAVASGPTFAIRHRAMMYGLVCATAYISSTLHIHPVRAADQCSLRALHVNAAINLFAAARRTHPHHCRVSPLWCGT
ncbi:hypothetical protein RLO149_c013500 [Roseobacter litoralis Och 149]|uniref:Uncharacterized protein n=1 Tax=Roseobacter litoralis (strain ATCC 49566 / DSM 6996 / JCM 21268 / NBRC 15278 / OCh 149) TaxID=391595 RepID=F7ZE31_ROSLO|nr:hypothetical protein RLO149_c013500 [Roseobacter litoralis Och 149]